MFGRNFDHIYLNSTVSPIELECGVFIEADSNSNDKYIFSSNAESPMWAEIRLKEKNGFSDYNATKIREFVRTVNRNDYPTLNDEEFANFRVISCGNIADDILYRSSSPINPLLGRNIYADKACENAGIRTIINLADSKSETEAFDGYAHTYYADCDIYFGDMPLDFSSDEFRTSLALALRFISEREGPYFIHCTEGKYRTGLMIALLESLMGADFNTIQDDFIITYENFYTVSEGVQQSITEELQQSIKRLVCKYLCEIFQEESLDYVNLPAKATAYMKGHGLKDDKIVRLKHNLSGNIDTSLTKNVSKTLS